MSYHYQIMLLFMIVCDEKECMVMSNLSVRERWRGRGERGEGRERERERVQTQLQLTCKGWTDPHDLYKEKSKTQHQKK